MSLTDGWFWPVGSYRTHYVRAGVSLCGHWRVRTLLWGQGEHLRNRCHLCSRALEREAALRAEQAITYCALCKRELPVSRALMDTCSERCERAQLRHIEEDIRAQGSC